MLLLVVVVAPVLVFSVWLAKICLGCVVYTLLQSLPIPRLVLRFPSPPIGREHCPSPAQNRPYGWWYLVCYVVFGRLTCPLPIVFLSYSGSHFRPQHLVVCPAVSSTHGSGTVDVHLIQTSHDDEVDHMPVTGTRLHPRGLAFILLLEHGVRHYQFELRAQSQ